MSDARAAYSIAEVCAKFGVGRTTVYNAIKNGALQTRKVGRRTLVTVEALDLWIGGLPMGGAPSRTIAPPIHNRHSRVKLDPLNQSGGETKRLGSPKDLVRTNSKIPICLLLPDPLRAPDDQTNGFDELLNASIDILNREHSASRISLNEKAISIVGLAAGCMLDRMGTAALETKCSNLSRARKIATAALMDCEDSPEASAALFKSLASEGFIDLVNGDSGTALIEQAKVAFHQTRKVHAITNHIVRCAVYPDPRNRGAIEDAKVFVQKWDEDCGISAISKIWEKYRLAAPFIYAFHLEERSFRPLDAVSSANVINWARTVVARQGRIQRILGHGAFAVDVLARTAKGQRQADFFGIKRIIPPVRPFSSQERLIMDSIDRAAPLR